MATTKLKTGDRVILVANRHGDTRSNPIWGGAHGEVPGTVKANSGTRDIGSFPVSVLWDNEHQNSYDVEDLMFLEGTEKRDDFGFKVKFEGKVGEVVCGIKDHYIVNFGKDVKGFSCDGKYEKGSCLIVKKSEIEKVKEKKLEVKDKGS